MTRQNSHSAESALRAQETVRQQAVKRSEARQRYWLDVVATEEDPIHRANMQARVELEDCLIHKLMRGDYVAETVNKYRVALETWTDDARS